MRALIVDDNAENRYLLEVLLKAHGWEVACAGNGVEALARLRAEPCDFIVSDVLMPTMDGYRLCREVKRDPVLKELPFVFITAAYIDEKDEQFALSLGADRYLRRPIEPEAFMAAIEDIVAKHRGGLTRPGAGKEETHYLAEYGERVQHQLEQKVQELEAEIANRRRVERALRTLSECNQALVRAADEDALLQAMCRTIVEEGGYRMAWVGFAEHDADRTVRPAARYGYEAGYIDGLRITWADAERGRGPTGTAIRTGALQVNQDFERNASVAPWQEAALRRGYRSSIALPLKSDGAVLGALMIYAAERDAFNPDEVALLTELAGDLAYGIRALRIRAERDRALSERGRYFSKLKQNLQETIQALAAMVEMRDPYTAGHSHRVARLAVAIARELGLPEDRIDGVQLAASVHDVGKMRIPTEILTRPRLLADVEYEMVKIHARAGHDILRGIDFPWPVAQTVLQHHERLDGSGYPDHLQNGEILLEAQILAVADVVESIVSYRPYRAALGLDAAIAEITRNRGTLYNAQAVDACLRLLKDKGFQFPDTPLGQQNVKDYVSNSIG